MVFMLFGLVWKVLIAGTRLRTVPDPFFNVRGRSYPPPLSGIWHNGPAAALSLNKTQNSSKLPKLRRFLNEVNLVFDDVYSLHT